MYGCIVTEKHIIGENNACACGAIIIDGTLGGKTEEEVNALMDQLKAYVDSGNTTIIVTGSKPAMIAMARTQPLLLVKQFIVCRARMFMTRTIHITARLI